MPSLELMQQALMEKQKSPLLGENKTENVKEEVGDYAQTALGPMKRISGISEFITPDLVNQYMREAGGGAASGIPSIVSKGAMIGNKFIPQAESIFKKGIEKLPGMAKDISRYIGETVKGGTVAAGMGEHPTDDLAKSLTTSGALNLLPFGLRQVSRFAEMAHPNEYIKKLSEKISTLTEKGKQKESTYFEPIEKTFGNYNIMGRGHPQREVQKIIGNEKIEQYFNSKIDKLYDTFKQKPSYSNAKALQEQMFDEIKKLSTKPHDAANRATISALTDARNALRKTMYDFLQERRPDLAKKFTEGSQYRRFEQEPLNVVSDALKKGSVGGREVANLMKALQGLESTGKLERQGLPKKDIKKLKLSQEHPLKGIKQELESKLHTGKITQALANTGLASTIASLLGGAVLPGAGHLVGGAAGGALGLLLNKMYGGIPYDLVQNPKLVNLLKRIQPGYEKANPFVTKEAGEYVGK